jgi:hypothetical protein
MALSSPIDEKAFDMLDDTLICKFDTFGTIYSP